MCVQEYAESPLRQVRRKEAKERQKQYAATHKAALEVERINKQQASRMTANRKSLLWLIISVITREAGPRVACEGVTGAQEEDKGVTEAVRGHAQGGGGEHFSRRE